jgi:hypothetical protein
VTQVLTIIKTIAHWVYGLKAASGAVENYLNPVELARVVLPALLHGGGVYAVLTSLLNSASTVFAAPYAAIAVSVLTALVQVARLLGHGTDPKPTTPATSA